VAALPSAVADGHPLKLKGPRPISGKSPFPNGCGGPGDPQINSEAEPSIAVDPRNPRRILATWQQDRFGPAGGAQTDLVAVSGNRGRTWTRHRIPGASACTGGADDRTSDPWVSIGGDGRQYLGVLTFDVFPGLEDFGTPTQQRVSRSLNGGRSWKRPTLVIDDDTYNDRAAVTADPRRPRHAYIAWVKRLGTFGESGVAMFSRSTDGGASWSPQQTVFTPAAGDIPDPTLIEVLPNGDLLYVFLLANGSTVIGGPPIPWEVMAMRSDDLGRTWSEPVQIAAIDNPVAPEDPKSGAEVRAFPVVDTAVGRDGTVYVVWNEIFSEKRSRISISRSRDGGRRWSKPKAVANRPTQAFVPAVAVAADGVVGVTFDDFTGDRARDDALTTRVWLFHSGNRGRTWTRQKIGGPFDMLTTSATSSTGVAGRFIGDYQGLAASGRGFVAAFAEGKALGRHRRQVRPVRGPSDIMFVQALP
jgi:hypothetical protein